MSDGPWWRERGPTRPLRVEGGLKARSTRGAIGQSWWSGRFIEVLESLGVGGRLSRGRTYARSGQVISLELSAGSVTGRVQGSRPKPYDVRIGVPSFGKPEWGRVEQAMADSAWYAAKLLAGEMPPDIEEVFTSVGLALFPASAADLAMDCTCPDQAVPCKHLAAVIYLLAESFDDDPFGILALRGRDRDTLLEHIRERRAPAPEARSDAGASADPPPAEPGPPPLTECLDRYYAPAGAPPVFAAPAVPVTALLDQLPPLELTVRGRTLPELLRPVYLSLAEE